MFLQKALEQISGFEGRGTKNPEIHGISYDSRSVVAGDLFVAIKGEKSDGARFIPQAIDRGAVAIASENKTDMAPEIAAVVVPDARRFLAEFSRVFYNDPAEELKLAAITGTNGKTTTSYLMDSIFRQAGIRACLVGTIGMKIADRSFHSEHTTPESSDLLKFFRQSVEEGCTHGALEVSSHSLALKRVFGTRFRIGVFMNLTRDHLDFHKDMESYYQAKKILFSADNGNRIETAVINIDDPYGKRMSGEIGCPVISFGFGEGAQIRVLENRNRVDGTDLKLQTPAGGIRYELRLIGRPNIYNVMAATGTALALGLAPEEFRKGIEGLEGVPGRVERVDAGQDFTVVVDYAHSPDSLENLLNTVSGLPHQKIITVFGCGGDRDRTKRPIMGEIAVRKSDVVLATSDNPRSEDPLAILAEIEAGLKKGPAPYRIVPDRLEAIKEAVSLARKGDVVVIAGKGHEDYQILRDKTIPFDDRKLAGELIREIMRK
jgi:UDP-N-acetylmuramoyl-L-alanyl-D-glutamate--2,6-diaminopimelate ligase